MTETRAALEGSELPALQLAAHELKSPLVLIRQLSLMASQDDLSVDQKRQVLHKLTLTCERALRLTTDLTKTARLVDALPSIEPINVQEMCELVVNDIQPLYQAHHKKLRFNSRKKPPTILAERQLLQRSLLQLADNALHYSDDQTPVDIFTTHLKSQHKVRIFIRDKGPAISLKRWRAGDLLQSWQPSRPASSGLGLYIVEQFCQAMGGRLGLVRHRDGVSFFIELPTSTQLRLL